MEGSRRLWATVMRAFNWPKFRLAPTYVGRSSAELGGQPLPLHCRAVYGLIHRISSAAA